MRPTEDDDGSLCRREWKEENKQDVTKRDEIYCKIRVCSIVSCVVVAKHMLNTTAHKNPPIDPFSSCFQWAHSLKKKCHHSSQSILSTSVRITLRIFSTSRTMLYFHLRGRNKIISRTLSRCFGRRRRASSMATSP